MYLNQVWMLWDNNNSGMKDHRSPEEELTRYYETLARMMHSGCTSPVFLQGPDSQFWHCTHSEPRYKNMQDTQIKTMGIAAAQVLKSQLFLQRLQNFRKDE